MTTFSEWLTPDVVRALGWTLVHFLWQGAAIAVLLYVMAAFIRSALARYNLALAALLLMAGTPFMTFLYLNRAPADALSSNALTNSGNIINSLHAITNTTNGLHGLQATAPPVDWLTWFVGAWLVGVAVFGIRAFGGWVLLERLRREKAQPVVADLYRRCLTLQQRLGITKSIRYLESHLVDSPAVVGWFRPIVLLPVSALTGLSIDQVEAVIAHELAHVKRLDCFVNLFQIVIETALFYHPGVWWVSRMLRAERENCCDDVAVAVCGNAGAYARALTLMETWRATPVAALAANSASLKSRISRVLGLDTITHSVPRAGLGVLAVLCAAGALLASTSFNVNFAQSSDAVPTPQTTEEATAPVAPASTDASPAVLSAPTVRVQPAAETTARARLTPAAPAATAQTSSAPEVAQAPVPPEPPAPSTQTSGDNSAKASYIDGIHAAGLTNLTVDELIALKIQGVTPEYIREIRAAGLNPSVHELISMKAMGVTAEFARKARSDWNDVTIRELISMKAQGLDPSDVASYRQLGLKDLNLHQLLSLKAVGATPDYIRAMQAAGFSNQSAHDYVSARAVGVTPDYVRAMQSAGFSHLSMHEYISARAQGVTPEFIEKVRSHGFNNLTLRQLIGLKQADVF